MGKGALLDSMGAEGEERVLLSHALDKQAQARRGGILCATDFLSPHEQALVRDLLRRSPAANCAYLFTGGVPDAERQIVAFYPDWMTPDVLPLRALRAVWHDADTLSHRDLLGSLMGLGIVRGKIGDIYTGASSADVLALDSVTEFLLTNWSAAGRVKLRVEEIALSDVVTPERKGQELRDTVSSVRLDAVMASGFRLSRSKAVEIIRAGRVQVNWLDCAKPDRILSAGDCVSARGLGRMTLTRIGELTRKGRTPVFITRFL